MHIKVGPSHNTIGTYVFYKFCFIVNVRLDKYFIRITIRCRTLQCIGNTVITQYNIISSESYCNSFLISDINNRPVVKTPYPLLSYG